MIYTIGIYHSGFFHMTKATAKLFMHGRSQAVCLPKEFRMPGKEVEIWSNGDIVHIKPVQTIKNAWGKTFAAIDALGPIDDYPTNQCHRLNPG
jgi:antitoxin VapB